MGRFVEVSRDQLESFLQAQGFRREVQGDEVVYLRDNHIDPNVKVKVYTSLTAGSNRVRACGADAIRVCTVYDNGQRSFGVGKFPKLLRTAPEGLDPEGRVQVLLTRLYERMRDAYARGNQFIRQSKQKVAS